MVYRIKKMIAASIIGLAVVYGTIVFNGPDGNRKLPELIGDFVAVPVAVTERINKVLRGWFGSFEQALERAYQDCMERKRQGRRKSQDEC